MHFYNIVNNENIKIDFDQNYDHAPLKQRTDHSNDNIINNIKIKIELRSLALI